MKYLSIQVEVDAVQFTGSNIDEILALTNASNIEIQIKDGIASCLITINGIKLLVLNTDYIIKDSESKITIMKQDVFNRNYIKEN